ncbi:conjugal transfer protein TraL [Thalassospira sp. NFXS8]|uniref:conjugal transfer protein TraL n=1 Tax=Thalassospira sp. NFXS8 TaxID=2819093 RepID=UPI0032DEAC9F
MTLQGKGGVGKSFISSLLAQYYLPRAENLQCFDTDPVNQTFAGYKAFPVETIRLGERQDEINARYFDALIEKIIDLPEESVVVIDNGASTFLPLLGYLVEAQAFDVLHELGHEIRLHTIVTGGQASTDTVQGLGQILTHLPELTIVVWLNEYFGRVERRAANGEIEGFEQSGLYKKNKDRIHALVRLPEVRKETFGHDVEQMMRARLTFDEAVQSPEFAVMARQRLKMTWRTLHNTMEQAVL